MLIANRSFNYGGRRVRAGDEFQAKNSRDAKLLTAVGHVSEAPDKPVTRTYTRRDMVAETPKKAKVEEKAEETKDEEDVEEEVKTTKKTAKK